MAIDLLKQVAQDVTVQRRTQISRGSRADSEARKTATRLIISPTLLIVSIK